MNMSISLTANTQLNLSASRIEKLMNSDIQQATKLNVFDRVLEFFRPQSREVALRELHHMLHDGGTSNFQRFNLLTQLAGPESKALFTVNVLENPGEKDCTIEYAISGEVIRTETISAFEKGVIALRLGKPQDTELLQEQMSTIEEHQIKPEKRAQEMAEVRDQSFKDGGVNKKFHEKSGLLRADTEIGRADFERELKLAQYAEDRPELASYISTQRKITDHDKVLPNLNPKHDYAVVDIYDKDHVASAEMDRCLNTLTRDQAKSLLPQFVDLARVLYKNKVAHRDLHMHNLVVHRVKDTGSVHLKAIDFGRMVMGEGPEFEEKKFEDIDYLFDRQGATELETFARNRLPGFLNGNVEVKHYPIHKLCAKFNERGVDLEPLLSQIGKYLKHDLQHAGESKALIDAAFDKASQTLQLGFSQLQLNPAGIEFA